MPCALDPSTPRLSRRSLARAGGLAVAAAPFALACGRGSRSLRVFAAASLASAFEELCSAFAAARTGPSLELQCAGTPTLVLQMREGARVDVFASADEENMSRACAFVAPVEPPRRFASNRLCVITPKGDPAGIDELADLVDPSLTVLLCGPDVPAGRYARRLIERAGLDVRSASDEPSVRAVVQKVALGEADAGIVYRTDARAAGDRVSVVDVPEADGVVAHYPIAPLSAGPSVAFVEFVLSAEGRDILEEHGFGAP